MSACDALVFTSMLEGSPNVVKEALACDLPVVSVPVGDVATRLRGVAGCELCADERPETIAAALERVLRRGGRAAGGRGTGAGRASADTARHRRVPVGDAAVRRRMPSRHPVPSPDRPLVTAVIPCRNEARYIGRASSRSLGATIPRIGSSAGVRRPERGRHPRDRDRYAARHSYIRLVDNPQRITPCAMNAGIRKRAAT